MTMAQRQSKASHQSSMHPTLRLITGDQNNTAWKSDHLKNTNCARGNATQKRMKPSTALNVPAEFEINPWICREVKTLSSLESNCESETSEDEMKAEETQIEHQMDMDDDYVTFCNELTKSPDKDAASSRLFCAAICSGRFSFVIESDDEDDFDDDDDEEEEELGDGIIIGDPGPNGDFECFEISDGRYCSSSSAKFNPFTISGLFLPSLLSPEISDVKPSLIFEPQSFCGITGADGNEEDEEFVVNEKLQEVNRKWQLEYEAVTSEGESNAEFTEHACARKMVHFATEDTFIKIPNKVEWAGDYEAARKGPWEQCYRDHQRFANRIEAAGPLLSRVLDSDHRSSIFRSRYQDAELDGAGDETMNLNRVTSSAS